MRLLRAALAGAVLCAVQTASVLTPPAASGLSCTPPAWAAMDAEHVFAGTIVERRADHLVMEVSEVWRGGPVVERVRLPLYRGMGIWYPRIAGGAHRSPPWVVATYDDLTVGPCSIWRMNDVCALRPAHPAGPVARTADQPDQVTPSPMTGIHQTPSTVHAPGIGRVWAADETAAAILGATLW